MLRDQAGERFAHGIKVVLTIALLAILELSARLAIKRPESVQLRWHRAGFRRCWNWKSIDTPKLDRFQPTDRAGCEALQALFLRALGQ
jgi:hypothetical protein